MRGRRELAVQERAGRPGRRGGVNNPLVFMRGKTILPPGCQLKGTFMHDVIRGPRLAAALILAVLIGAVAGCVKNKVVVQVKPDGSGNILVTRVISPAMVQMVEGQMKQLTASMDKLGPDVPDEVRRRATQDPFFNEESLSNEASQYGAGVTYVKARKYDEGGSRGAVIQYAFTNVGQLRLSRKPAGRRAMGGPGGGEDEGNGVYRFAFRKGTPCVLTVQVPEMPPRAAKDDAPAPDAKREIPAREREQIMAVLGKPLNLKGDEGMDEIMRRMMKDMEVSLSVEVLGQVAKSTAAHPYPGKANRFVLIKMDMNQMMNAPAFKRLSQSAMGAMDEEEMTTFMLTAPGALLDTNRSIRIEFNPASAP